MPVCPPVRRTFSDEHGTGTFHSLGALPRRKHDTTTRKPPVFHIAHDDDDDDDDDHSTPIDEHVSSPLPPPPANVPFPRSTSPPSPQSSFPAHTTPARPQLVRGASSPIQLSNGKPLKSSLKSSSSSPPTLTPPQAQHVHLRSRSEPSSLAVAPKNVHFPEKDYALATVRVFNRSARPAALSNPANGNGDETETEGEDTPPTRFPFPPVSPVRIYEIDPTKSSPLPSKYFPANLLLESLSVSLPPFSSPSSAAKPFLAGSILVRNLAFEKHVIVRFTLDDWQTVSEVGAHYVESLSKLPSNVFPSPTSPGDPSLQRGRGWDRFTFAIRLEDYVHSLSTRTLWLAVCYRVNSTYPEPGSNQCGPGGEWWDNNGGTNFCVCFRPAVAATAPLQSRPRRETVSAPVPSRRTHPQHPATCTFHALGLITPSQQQEKNAEMHRMKDTDTRSMLQRACGLNLCNYAPPTIRVAPSVSRPSAGSPRSSLPSLITSSEPSPSEILRLPPDEDTASPASSTLSTPSVSPTITPRVIIGGQPATPANPNDSGEDDIAHSSSRPGHIADWDWSAPNKAKIEVWPHQHPGFVPDSEPPQPRRDIPSPPEKNILADSNLLYNAFVTQWCFAQGPSLSHHVHDDVSIMT